MGDVFYTYVGDHFSGKEDEITKKLVYKIKDYGCIRDEDAWVTFVDFWKRSDTRPLKKEVNGWDTWDEWKAFLKEEKAPGKLKKKYNGVIECLRIKRIIIEKEPSYKSIVKGQKINSKINNYEIYNTILQVLDNFDIIKHYDLLTELEEQPLTMKMKAIEFNEYINTLIQQNLVKKYLYNTDIHNPFVSCPVHAKET